MWKTILSKGLGVFSSGPAKFIAVATMLTTITGFCVWGYNSIHEAGYNEAALKYEAILSNNLQEEIAKARTKWKIETEQAVEAARQEQVVVERTKTIFRDVYKTKYVCEDVGENALELLNRVFKEEVE